MADSKKTKVDPKAKNLVERWCTAFDEGRIDSDLSFDLAELMRDRTVPSMVHVLEEMAPRLLRMDVNVKGDTFVNGFHSGLYSMLNAVMRLVAPIEREIALARQLRGYRAEILRAIAAGAKTARSAAEQAGCDEQRTALRVLALLRHHGLIEGWQEGSETHHQSTASGRGVLQRLDQLAQESEA